MTESEARGYIQGKLDCMNKCDVFEREHSRNKDLCDSCDYCYSQGNFGQQKEAFEFAINALGKQIPKKLKEHTQSQYGCIPVCGVCNGIMDLMQGDLNYCPNCGQKLNWESDEK